MDFHRSNDALEAPEGSLVCRVDGSAWWIVAVFWGLSAWFGAEGLFSDDPMDVQVVDFCVSGVLIAAGAVAALWISRACIIADSEGLRWRGIGGWHASPWDSVTDYHHSPSYGRGGWLFIETKAGSLTAVSLLTCLDGLRRIVQEKAAHASAREWWVKGARPEDPWPRTVFTSPLTWLSLILFSVLLAVGGVAFAALGVSVLVFIEDYYASGSSLLLSHMMALFFIVQGSIALLLARAQAITALHTLQARGEKLSATPEGLQKELAGRIVLMAWDDISRVESVRPGDMFRWFRVHADGETAEFGSTVSGWRVLGATLARHAPALKRDVSWMFTSSSDYAGAPKSFWSGAQPGLGQHIHHYRVRGTTVVFWHLLGALLLSTVAVLAGSPPSSQSVVAVSLNALVALPLLYALWCWTTSHVRTDETGIEWRGPLGTRRLLWGDVQEFRRTGLGAGYVVQGAGARIVFWNGISEFEDLVREIERRTANRGDERAMRSTAGNTGLV